MFEGSPLTHIVSYDKQDRCNGWHGNHTGIRHQHDQNDHQCDGMHHTGHRRASAIFNIGCCSCDCSCRRNASKQSRGNISCTLGYQLHIRAVFSIDHAIGHHTGKQRLNGCQYCDGKCIRYGCFHCLQTKCRKMEGWQCITDRIKISNGRYLQRKELHHQNSHDDCDQRTWNFFENVGRYNQDCQTDSTHNQCIRIYRIDISNKCFQFFHGLDRFYPIRISHTEEIFQLSDHDSHCNS